MKAYVFNGHKPDALSFLDAATLPVAAAPGVADRIRSVRARNQDGHVQGKVVIEVTP